MDAKFSQAGFLAGPDDSHILKFFHPIAFPVSVLIYGVKPMNLVNRSDDEDMR
ncbi:MAG: hypothetical protein KAS65_12750 [Candidatus Aminicenantes bacterium]|nr:hypothetical protein [Candidatus Aminicenantes bacterium]